MTGTSEMTQVAGIGSTDSSGSVGSRLDINGGNATIILHWLEEPSETRRYCSGNINK